MYHNMPAFNRLQKKGRVYSLTVPVAVVRALQAKPGDYFRVMMSSMHTLTLEHLPLTDKLTNLNADAAPIEYVNTAE